MRDKILLRQLQALPLDAKVLMSQQRIREWYNHFEGKVVISFSGGKDSTVLAHLVHQMYPDVPMVFANTGLEYPEIQAFARKMGAEFVRPKMSFSEVISKYGYPIIGKEVAEAIHFARRIVLIGGGIQRNEIQANRDSRTTNRRKRTELEGQRENELLTAPPGGIARTDRMETGEPHRQNSTAEAEEKRRHLIPPPRESCAESKEQEDNSWGRTDWRQWRRKAIAGVEPGFTGGSQFNKKKWLPLCQETAFNISHYCCNVMKKSPMGIYQRRTGLVPYIGTLAEESRMRAQAWIRHGCNSFEGHKKTSQPLSFWTEQDILQYILQEGLEICSVYGEILAADEAGMMYDPVPGIPCNLKCSGCERTGCVFCGFGAHLEKGETRFQRLGRTHPKQYDYCLKGGQWVDNPKYDPTAPEYDGEWKNWNPKKIWVPSKEGLGMKFVFDECNRIYGKDFIRYD